MFQQQRALMKTDKKVGKKITKEEKVMNQSAEKIIAYVESWSTFSYCTGPILGILEKASLTQWTWIWANSGRGSKGQGNLGSQVLDMT